MFLPLKRFAQVERETAHDKVSSRSKIIAILRQLEADRELLCVRVVGSEEPSYTAILGVKDSQNCILLDELNNTAAHKSLQQSRKLLVECRLRGMLLRFACRLLKTECDTPVAVYAVSIPDRIARTQRRGDFRLRLSSGSVTPVTVPRLDGRTVNGEALDLSASGLGALFNTRSVPNLGQVLPDVSLSLPMTGSLKVNLEVRFARLDSAQRMLRIGARFINLQPEQQRQLSRFLAEQQRKRRRHDAG